ncbi:MAG: site-2 protease family protein [Candidatus Parcubacteria bacterium]|uniref:site-2 protease family protein n=1 Tax=Phormidesmis priestleyi TaxID=268141 RepID=UPI00083AEDEA|nr:site-2 protease family protein [Phormidesmis priestleyi]MBC7824426.1 site-2 protease family protein [Leptolyngbyaceae cyanobacterium LF-bin-113]
MQPIFGFGFVGFLAIAMRVEFISVEFFRLGAQTNFALCLFNLLPIPPLDGFHIFSNFFPDLKTLEGSQFSLFALVLLFVLGLGTTLYSISDLIIGALLQ